MTEAGQRGSCSMGQPPRGGDQLIQPDALIALEQLDHARDLRALTERWPCRRGCCGAGRHCICSGILFRRFLVCVLRNGRAGYRARDALIGGDRPQSRGSQFQRIRLSNFLVAPPDLLSGLRFDLAHEAAREKLGGYLPRFTGFQRLRHNEAAICSLPRFGQKRNLRVGEFGSENSSDHPLGLAAMSPSPPRAPHRRRTGGGRGIRRSSIGAWSCRHLSALEHRMTIALLRDERE
jgi:hypothetical protein